MKVGVFGGGQLGRMMALAGYPFNLRFSFYDAAVEIALLVYPPARRKKIAQQLLIKALPIMAPF